MEIPKIMQSYGMQRIIWNMGNYWSNESQEVTGAKVKTRDSTIQSFSCSFAPRKNVRVQYCIILIKSCIQMRKLRVEVVEAKNAGHKTTKRMDTPKHYWLVPFVVNHWFASTRFAHFHCNFLPNVHSYQLYHFKQLCQHVHARVFDAVRSTWTSGDRSTSWNALRPILRPFLVAGYNDWSTSS